MKIKRLAEIGEGVGTISRKDGGDFEVFKATLASVSISKNMVQYTENALTPLVENYTADHNGGYEGAPIFKDHNVGSIDNIIGQVQNVVFEDGKLVGDLHLMSHREETKLVRLGLVKHVSFHNRVEGVICSICGKEYGKECREHELGKEYDKKICYMIPKKLGAIELSLVAFGGISDATIGETLEGFEERLSPVDTKEDDDSSDETESIIPDDNKLDDDVSNDNFINEEEKDLNRELSKENKIIDKTIREAKNMSEDGKELQYKQELEKLELEKKSLAEKLTQSQEVITSFEEDKKLREEELKKSLIDDLTKIKPLTDEKRKEYMLFDIKYLEEFINILKDKEVVNDEPMPKGMASTVGEKVNPQAERVRDYIKKAFWG